MNMLVFFGVMVFFSMSTAVMMFLGLGWFMFFEEFVMLLVFVFFGRVVEECVKF